MNFKVNRRISDTRSIMDIKWRVDDWVSKYIMSKVSINTPWMLYDLYVVPYFLYFRGTGLPRI